MAFFLDSFRCNDLPVDHFVIVVKQAGHWTTCLTFFRPFPFEILVKLAGQGLIWARCYGYFGILPLHSAQLVYTRWAGHWTTLLSFRFATAAMSGLRLQNRFSFLDDQSPSNDDAAVRQRQEQRPAFSWNDPPGTVEQANSELKAFYHRKLRIETPLGFDDTGKLWQWYDHHATPT